jgi:hypothetical protein
MKKLILLFLGAGLIFFGCEKDNCTAPQATDFTGASTWVADIDEGTVSMLSDNKILIIEMTAEWYEDATDAKVSGKSIWTVNWLVEPDWSSAKLWGTAVIYVGVASGGNNGSALGVWELTWEGQLTEGVFDPEIGFLSEGKISVTANGFGKSGEVNGKLGHWNYSLDVEKGFVYNFTGSFL